MCKQKCGNCDFKCPEIIQSLLVLSNMVSEICIEENIPLEIKSKIKNSYSIIQKESLEKSVNKECMTTIM